MFILLHNTCCPFLRMMAKMKRVLHSQLQEGIVFIPILKGGAYKNKPLRTLRANSGGVLLLEFSFLSRFYLPEESCKACFLWFGYFPDN